jgi:formylglycine-generating enzyme required for sulfatase activity
MQNSPESSPLKSWQERLSYLQAQEAIAASPSQKFELEQQIAECHRKIQELQGQNPTQPPSPENPNAAEYRSKVREYLATHRISEIEEIELENLLDELEISIEEGRKIREEEKPLIKARQVYRKLLEAYIQKGDYHFDAEIKEILQRARQDSNLLDWEIQEIEEPILEQADREYRQRLRPFSYEIVTVDRTGTITKRERKENHYFEETLAKGIFLPMVYIPAGKFWMGTEDEEIERLSEKYAEQIKNIGVNWFQWERPRHEVTLSPFCLGQFLITQEQWKIVASSARIDLELPLDPSYVKGDKNPVECVTWFMAVEFCKRLSQLTGKVYRLPSEAEWEYGCRAATQTPFHYGETITNALANYDGNYIYAEETKEIYRQKTTAVEQFPPNAFGLHDTHGNLWEWCEDDWHGNYQGSPDDGGAWIDDNDNRYQNLKCLRGGSGFDDPDVCRSANRNRNYPGDVNDDIGFRVVCSAAGLFPSPL